MSRLYLPDRTYPAIQASPGRRRRRGWMPPGTQTPTTPYLLNDQFTDANGTALTSHTSDDGKSWQLQTNGAAIGWASSGAIQANRLINAAATGMVAAGSSVADTEITADIYFASAIHAEVCGILARSSTSAATVYVGGLLCWSGVWTTTIRRYVAGGYAELVTGGFGASQPTLSSTHSLKFKLLGSQLTLYVDGVQQCTVSNGDITAAGLIGVTNSATTSSTGIHFDNIQAV